MKNTALATIDLSAIRHNLEVVRHLCPASRVMAMVKSNAYGHGITQAADALAAADGLAVARLQEALTLRKAGCHKRMLLLATLLDSEDLALCSALDIDVVAHSSETVRSISAQARRSPLKVWLKLDCGMHRAGLQADEFIRSDMLLSAHPGVLDLVHMTHLSSAADPKSKATSRQLSNFRECHAVRDRTVVSIANSAAIISRPETRRGWVRPGLMLYGDSPIASSETLALRPAMRLVSYIISVRTIYAGESVGYDQTWTASHTSRIGTVGIGYGDGYPRHAQSGTPVWINGRLLPLIGRVSMDSITVDLSESGPVQVGDEVVLWGCELPVNTVAQHASTISYQLLASVQDRVTRQYR